MDLPWERHKPTIRDLYLVKDMTRKDVMKEMGERHQFNADAGQYERQFKKWGFRKNLAPKEWQLVSRRIEKRKREGKDTDVRIDGVSIPEKKLRKAITRYGQGSTLEKLKYELKQGTNCRSPTPEGLCFSPLALSSTMSVDLTTLPWCRFSTTATLSLPLQFQGSGTIIPHQRQMPFQENFKAFIPNFHGNVSKPYQGFSEGSDLDIFMIATFFAFNHIQRSYRLSHELVHKHTSESAVVTQWLKTPNAFQILQRLKLEREPTVDALCEVMLKEALQSCNLDLVKMLLRHLKIEVDKILPGPWEFYSHWYRHGDHHGRRPLQAAIQSGNVQIVQLLLSHGADPNVTGTYGEDMLTLAARTEAEDIVLTLLETFEGSVAPAFMACLHCGLPSTTEILWDRLKRSTLVLDQFQSEALPAAARAGSIAIVQDLLDNGVDVNSFNDIHLSALQMAVCTHQNKLEMVKLLIDSGAEVNCRFDEGKTRIPTALQLAVYNKSFEAAAYLIASGADVNAECGDDDNKRDLPLIHYPLGFGGLLGLNALEAAVEMEYDDTRFVRLLLQQGAHVDDAAMAKAASNCDFSVVRLLLDFGAPYSPFVLLAAAGARQVEVVRHCLQIGIYANYLDGGKTAFTMAISHLCNDHSGFLETLSLLLDYGADVNLPGTKPTALELAIEIDDEHLVEDLLSRGARCDKGVISTAALYSKPAVLEELLSRALACPEFLLGYVTSCTGHPALFSAVWAGQVESMNEKIEILLRNGINSTTSCATMALQQACLLWEIDVSFIGALVLAGTPVNFPETAEDCPCWSEYQLNDQRQPLQILAKKGWNEAVCFLLKHGADPNLYGLTFPKDYDQYSSFDEENIEMTSILSSAVLGGHLTTVKLLLDAGSDVNQPALGRFGRTALQVAAGAGNVDILEELTGANANVNADPAEYGGVTALQAAAIGGFVGIASRLVDLGADVNAAAAKVDGRTALEGAAEHGRIDMVQFLLSAGADLESPEFGTLQYERAVELAKKEGYNAVARLLQRHRTSLG